LKILREAKGNSNPMGRVRSDVAVNRELETLRHMLNKAIEWEMLDMNPFDRFKKPICLKKTGVGSDISLKRR